MKINWNLLIATGAVCGVAVFAITRMATPCEGNYKFSFNPKELGFECTLPSVGLDLRDALTKAPTSVIPEAETPISNMPVITQGITSDEIIKTVPCDRVRGSLTFRKRLGDTVLADSLCKNKVSSVPVDYAERIKVFKLQDDGSITFNTGYTHNNHEIWCNCHP